MNENFAFEAGYLQPGSKKAHTITYEQSAIPLFPNTVEDNVKLKQYAIDFAAKGIIQIANNLHGYGKLGLAYLHSQVQSDLAREIGVEVHLGFAEHVWAPEVAVGISYDITPNVSVDTSWTHIHPTGNNAPGNIDFVAAGLSYNFG